MNPKLPQVIHKKKLKKFKNIKEAQDYLDKIYELLDAPIETKQ